ncbi:unnamed protein product [Heterobilharzia americana]|nr:unnamed protein product [Heterobilharzia americana]
MVGFDITSLYTNIPINMALEAVKNGLKIDNELTHRTEVPVEEIVLGVRLCLTSTLFKFQNKIYKPAEGVAVGPPISPIITDIFMDSWEEIDVHTFNHTPKIWFRYVDDTFTALKSDDINRLLTHINSVVNTIQVTCDLVSDESELAMLDCKIK